MRKATLPILLLLLTTASMGCEPRQGSETRPVHCTVIVDGPKKLENADKIAGMVRFRCGAPGAEKLTLKVRLEKRAGDKWHTVSSKTFTLRGKETMTDELLKYESRQVNIACSEGSFRTVVDWSRVSRKDTDGDNLISGGAKDPCVRIFE